MELFGCEIIDGASEQRNICLKLCDILRSRRCCGPKLTEEFTDHSKAVLLWIICVMYVLCLSCFRIRSLLSRGHLL